MPTPSMSRSRPRSGSRSILVLIPNKHLQSVFKKSWGENDQQILNHKLVARALRKPLAVGDCGCVQVARAGDSWLESLKEDTCRHEEQRVGCEAELRFRTMKPRGGSTWCCVLSRRVCSVQKRQHW
jgi:hypothetical protein